MSKKAFLIWGSELERVEHANPVAYHVTTRRPANIAVCYAGLSKAERELGWKAKFVLNQMIEDTWQWKIMNPNGFHC